MKGYKRCKCRDGSGRELGASCPSLKRSGTSWNPSHGTWYGKAELPRDPDGKRVYLRQGGFATQDKMSAWFDDALHLLSIPEAGTDGHQARMEILALIQETRRRKGDLPSYDDLRRRYQEGAAFRPGSAGDYLIAWLAENREAGAWTATTIVGYESAVERLFLPSFGTEPLDRLRTSHVLRMVAAIDTESDRIRAARVSDDPAVRKSVAGKRPTGLATKRRILAILRSALNYAITEKKLITSNPVPTRIGGKGAGKNKQSRTRAKLWTAERETMWRENYEARLTAAGTPRLKSRFALWRSTAARPGPVMLWTPAHLGTFLDAAEGDRLYALFCIIAHCGLRRGEACGLRWEDTALDANVITIANQIVQVGWRPLVDTPKSESSHAMVLLDPEISVPAMRACRVAQLEERVAWGPAWQDTGFAFTREDGTPYHPAHLTNRFERIAFCAGLPPIRLHDLRHGAATLALAGGADIKAVSSMLRHSSIQITADIYADVLPELAAEVASKVVSMIPRQHIAAVAGAARSQTAGLPTVSLARTGHPTQISR